ncbi:MAG: sortase [Chloroflexota bacterium]|nr:sortase [Chloroflexota bacterium]
MIRATFGKEKKVQAVEDTVAAGYLTSEGKKARKPTPALRIVGNALIAMGLVMLLGIGGWYGFTQVSNQQFVEQATISYHHPVLDPPLDATPEPTQIPPPPPLPVISGNLAHDMGNIIPKPVVVDDSPPVHLIIPSVKIDTNVVPVTWQMIPSKGGEKPEWNVANYAVGHHAGTANPGQPGNVVMSGHVDYKGQVFKDLKDVHKGDEVVVQTEKGQYLYVVTDMVIVKEDGATPQEKRRNAQYMDPTADPTLTMITCWPYGIDDHRLVVIAKPYQSALSAQSEFAIR